MSRGSIPTAPWTRKKKNARAGYGVAIYETDADGRQKFLSAKYGRVVTSPRKTMYQGADKHSNNAGELTALLRAVQEERHEQGRVTFVVDSTYAINMATGRTVPTQRRKSANVELVRKLRGAYSKELSLRNQPLETQRWVLPKFLRNWLAGSGTLSF